MLRREVRLAELVYIKRCVRKSSDTPFYLKLNLFQEQRNYTINTCS